MKKYSKIKKRILISAQGGVLTSMLIMGAGSAFAQATPPNQIGNQTESQAAVEYVVPAKTARTGLHTLHRFNSIAKIQAFARGLGLDETQVIAEIKAGKTIKQILQEHGITLH